MTDTPWRTPHWFSSPHNFDPDVLVGPHPVELHDITVRDGEECADIAFTVDDKVRIAEALALAGIRRMEFFLTVPGWLEAVRAVMRRHLPLQVYVTWQPGRVERVLDLGVRHVMVWHRILEEHQRHLLRRSRNELVDETASQIEAARQAGCHVNLFINEASRAPLDQLRQVILAGKQAGAAAVTVVDSFGVARPAAIALLVRQVREWTSLPVDVHCHNDFGLSTANVLAAYEAGATGLNVSVNGLGYRAGNAALDEVVMALEVLYGVDTGVRLELLPWLSQLVADITGVPLGYFKPVSGKGAFSMEQWTTGAAMESAGTRPIAFPFEPEIIGRAPRVVVGKWSDTGVVIKKLAEYGLSASADQIDKILVACQRAGIARHRPLTDDEFIEIAVAGRDRGVMAPTAGRIALPVRYRLVAASFSLSMLLYIDRVAISTAKGPITSAFGLDDTRFGWILSAFALGYALRQTPAGVLADRWGARVMLTGVVTLWSLFTGLTGLAWSLGSLLILRFLFGVGEAGVPRSRARSTRGCRPASVGWRKASACRDLALAPPSRCRRWGGSWPPWAGARHLSGSARSAWRGRSLYAWFRNTPAEHAAVSASELRVIDAGRAAASSTRQTPIKLGALIRSVNMWLIMGQYFALNFTFFFCLTWLFPYLQRTYHLEALQTGLLASAPLIGGAIGNWVGGTIVDALYRSGRAVVSRRFPAMLGFTLSAAGLVASLGFHDPVSVVLCLTLAVFGADLALPASWAVCIDIGRAHTGAVAGTMNMAGNLGSFVTSLAFPYLLLLTGSTRPFFIVGAALNLAAVGLWLGVDPRRPVAADQGA